jgi:hypothetical protein
MQWWYSTPSMLPEMVGCGALLIVALHYLILSRRSSLIIASGVMSTICVLGFILCFYPPFQQPLAYLGVAILVGSIAPRITSGTSKNTLLVRIGTAFGVLLLSGTLLVLFYNDAREAIELARNTVYPGARAVSGGDLTIAKVFGGFFGFFMSETRSPAFWGNVCESSNFLMLFPI